MKYINKLASVFFLAALALLTMTSCEGGDLYNVGAPDWLAEMGGDEEEESIISVTPNPNVLGAKDNTTPWWTVFTDDYKTEAGKAYQIQFLNYGGSSNWNNFVLILRNEAKDFEYAVLRADNWGWGTGYTGEESDAHFSKKIENEKRDWGAWAKAMSLSKCTMNLYNNGDGTADVKITMLGADGNTYTQEYTGISVEKDNLYFSFTVDNSHVEFGDVDVEDSEPTAIVLNGVAAKVLQGTTFEDAFANVTATVTFAEGVTKTVEASELQIQAIPDMQTLGKKTLVAVYNKTYMGNSSANAVIGTATFEVVDKMYTCIGKTDNTSAFREEKTEDFKVEPGQTYVNFFTNYTNGVENWNNFIITLTKASGAEYCFVRADNWGLGDSYWDGCQSCDWDWANFKTILDGAKVTTYITNNGDGTADVKAVVLGSDGKTYTQNYKGLKNIDPEDFYFNLSMEKAHLEFDYVIGAEDNTSAFRSVSTDFISVPAGATMVNRFINYTDGAEFWNNFIITLYKADGTEYCFVRADNWGLGDSYWDGCQTCDWNWEAFKTNIDGALVTTYITNKGDGTADIKAVVLGSDGKTYTQKYTGLKNIDANDFGFKLSMEKAHLVFE